MTPGEPPDRGSDDDATYYTWTCPICHHSKTSFALDHGEGQTGRTQAVTALQSHIFSSDGEGHGPKEALPEGLDPDALVEHVTIE